MCDPISLGLAAIGGAASLLGGSNKSAPPPSTVITPAPAMQTTRKSDALVKVGDSPDATSTTSTPQYQGFDEKRVFGKPLGGLGRGGLGL